MRAASGSSTATDRIKRIFVNPARAADVAAVRTAICDAYEKTCVAQAAAACTAPVPEGAQDFKAPGQWPNRLVNIARTHSPTH